MKNILGIDIGGTKTALGIITVDGKIKAFSCFPTEKTTLGLYTQKLEMNLQQFMAENHGQIADLSGIGIGIRGWVDANGNTLKESSLFTQIDIDFRHHIERMSGIPVWIDNDVNAAANAERLWGHGRNFAHFVYVNIGTGTAYGIVEKGQLIRGVHNAAGEIGMALVSDTKGRGKIELEKLMSGRGIEERSRKLMGNNITFCKNTKIRWSAKDVVEAYKEGITQAKQLLDEGLDALALSLINTARILDPQLFVFGGGMVDREGWFVDLIQDRVKELCSLTNQHWNIETKVTALGVGEAGLLGAASLVENKETIMKEEMLNESVGNY